MKQVFNHRLFVTGVKAKRLREILGLREAAREIGISAATLSRIENSRMPDIITYANICKWLGVSLDTFITKAKKV